MRSTYVFVKVDKLFNFGENYQLIKHADDNSIPIIFSISKYEQNCDLRRSVAESLAIGGSHGYYIKWRQCV